jgi:hypothetical protein
MKGAIYVCKSGNTKIIGSKPVDATYAAIKYTCPTTCPLKGDGCYAETSFVGMINARMERRARRGSPLDLARAEAAAIDASYDGGKVPEGRALRIHVAGDSRTLAGTRIINNAVGRWKKRGGGKAWSYTHAFRHVPREEWSNVSILASVSNVAEVELARQQGYACTIVVATHPSDKTYLLDGSDIKWIPCPAQVKPGGKQIGCTDCKLCFNADRLFENNMGIAFAAHGVRRNNIKRYLNIIK